MEFKAASWALISCLRIYSKIIAKAVTMESSETRQAKSKGTAGKAENKVQHVPFLNVLDGKDLTIPVARSGAESPLWTQLMHNPFSLLHITLKMMGSANFRGGNFLSPTPERKT